MNKTITIEQMSGGEETVIMHVQNIDCDGDHLNLMQLAMATTIVDSLIERGEGEDEIKLLIQCVVKPLAITIGT